eukprot:CAMPEP_0118682482 /NCGR_PEP_ID=MMETSP0800-20121206/5507_1 /TAXON_ID=210618 ORGANISM="Striatella unipunctata, Strain CCMP2910" /NCGR_SAMPLE_ID=MMETSP0800 /ASSEMBLY_ACC=CAM_ASM_000638 /LENGTH=102 /DNA_ID=CAMNT_0006578871 /DNA_START=1214 /DNA_END=1522 /DNA_ORIENTATION=-
MPPLGPSLGCNSRDLGGIKMVHSQPDDTDFLCQIDPMIIEEKFLPHLSRKVNSCLFWIKGFDDKSGLSSVSMTAVLVFLHIMDPNEPSHAKQTRITPNNVSE